MSTNQNGKFFYPSDELKSKLNVKNYDEIYQYAAEHPESFWSVIASELSWFKPWDKVLEWEYPFAKWFVGGKTNIVYNALDRHVNTWRRNKLALIWEGENSEVRTYTYLQLQREVNRFANVLKAMGVQKGDRVSIYLPRIPEQMIAMLAAAKIGAIHTLVYAGFSVEALRDRINDAESKIVVTADGGFYNGKVVPLKNIVDEAVSKCPSIISVIVVKRTGADVDMTPGRDLWYHELMALPIASPKCDTEVMDATDPLFILYTSGTTGKPKGVVHSHGGYMVGTYITTKWVFDMKEEDTHWCTADSGWVTGHSYVVYGPLLNGATTVMYEGAPTYPLPDRWWSIVERHNVTIFYTAPTAIRSLMRYGSSWVNRRDLSTLRILGSVGEPINPEAWLWFYKVIGQERCPIMDTWWQTETGMHIITPLPCTPLKPGSASKPFPGIVVDVVDEEGESVKPGEEGFLIIKTPWPAMLQTVYKDPERYKQQYWSRFPGVYFAGDSAKKDEDGYIWIIGRVDDVIKVAGYRLGTAEIESALVSHPAVAEAAAIGKPDPLKGNIIKVFVILKFGYEPSEKLAQELKNHVGHELGPIAKPAEVQFVESLPKTRSGKIMRRVLRAQELGQPIGDLSTLED
ncbi:acetate--CoA ligase [Thermodesulfobium sp.]|jgi:acetyl-CoA synthetase|uniref:Acetate--CoA ligase n=1 Tax=Thermodesulfobium narugense TaxID=184064 RepID=A0A7C5KHX0_9BACT